MKCPIPAELDWVTERSKCTLANMFERLREDIAKDVDTRNALKCDAATFDISSDSDRFVVGRSAAGETARTATFIRRDRIIAVKWDSRPGFEAGVSLCDDGACRLSIDGSPLELWQVRRRALEPLFFGK